MAYKGEDGEEWMTEENYRDYLVFLAKIRERNKKYQDKMTLAVKKHWKSFNISDKVK